MSISGWSQQEPDGDRSRSGLSGVASPPGYRKPCGQFCILSAFVFVRIAFSLTATTAFANPITLDVIICRFCPAAKAEWDPVKQGGIGDPGGDPVHEHRKAFDLRASLRLCQRVNTHKHKNGAAAKGKFCSGPVYLRK